MLGCNESNISSSISANLGNSGEAMVEIHKYSDKQDQLATLYTLRKKFMAATLSYFL